MVYTIERYYIGPNGFEFSGWKVCVRHHPVGQLTATLPDLTFDSVTQASKWAREHCAAIARL